MDTNNNKGCPLCNSLTRLGDHLSSDFGLLLLRLGVAGFMLVHGIQKLQMVASGAASQFLDPIGIGAVPSIWLAIFAEVGCSLLILVGFCTRLASAALVINMGVAVFFHVQGGQPWAATELAAIYLLIYAALFFLGAGKFSVSHLLSGKFAGTCADNKRNVPF